MLQSPQSDSNPQVNNTSTPYRLNPLLGKYEEDFPLRKTGKYNINLWVVIIPVVAVFAVWVYFFFCYMHFGCFSTLLTHFFIYINECRRELNKKKMERKVRKEQNILLFDWSFGVTVFFLCYWMYTTNMCVEGSLIYKKCWELQSGFSSMFIIFYKRLSSCKRFFHSFIQVQPCSCFNFRYM